MDFLALVIFTNIIQSKTNFKGIYLVVALFYIVALLFQVYSAVFETLYGVTPMLYNDISVLMTGFMIVYKGLSVAFFVYAFAILILLSAIVLLIRKLLFTMSRITMTLGVKVTLLFLLIIQLVNFKFGSNVGTYNSIQYQSLMIGKNLKASFQAKSSLNGFSASKLVKEHPHELENLNSKPTLYFIAIESYGKLLFTHDSLINAAQKSLLNFQDKLYNSGYYQSSNFSVSPVTGGLSWIAYSNFSFGFDFKNQGTFDALLENRTLDQYTDLFKVFKDQGYTNYRLMPLFKSGKIVIPWEKYSKFYRVDEWIKYEDLNYAGELYGFGPAVPDQYALNYANDHIQRSTGPKTLFFLTVCSHNPFLVPDLKEDWRSLNNTKRSHIDGANLLVKPNFKNYSSAIDYELQMLSDFIVSNNDTNAVYVLFGDHQPPFLAKSDDGMETPMHIICKNRKFVYSFREYGFKQGSFPEEGKEIRHEAFLSMFLRQFQKSYGDSSPKDLGSFKYMPKGIKIR